MEYAFFKQLDTLSTYNLYTNKHYVIRLDDVTSYVSTCYVIKSHTPIVTIVSR